MMTQKNSGCPQGYIMRRGYTRKFKPNVKSSGFTVRRKGTVYTVRPKANTIRVPAACIKDRGLPGKGPREGEGIGKLRKGELIKYGYQYRLSDLSREKALVKAVTAYGALSVYHKLDAVAKLSVTHAPDASKIFAKDRDWIRLHYLKKK
jgi:ribosomal protein L28